MKVLFDSCDYDTNEDDEEMAIDSLALLLVDLGEALNKSYSFLVVGSRYCSWRGQQGYSFKEFDTIKEAVLNCIREQEDFKIFIYHNQLLITAKDHDGMSDYKITEFVPKTLPFEQIAYKALRNGRYSKSLGKPIINYFFN